MEEKLQLENNILKLYAPDSLSFIFTKIPEILISKIKEYKSLFDISEFRQLELHLFDNLDSFRSFVLNLREDKTSLPSYATGVFDQGKIIMYMNPLVIIGTPLYQNYLYTPAHETLHIMYKELILDKQNLERIIWFDEGMAKYFSGESAYYLKHFSDFVLKIKEETKRVPSNLNELKHGNTFCNEFYNGYDLSLLCVKYLVDTIGLDELKNLMSDIPRIKSFGTHIINDAFNYYLGTKNKARRTYGGR